MKLLACPHCGEQAMMMEYQFGDSSEWYYRVECADCYGWHLNKEDSIAEWNRRCNPIDEGTES